jgi:mannose-1-phosphate guanylyltransferase
MKALFLAGGFGSRLKEMTKNLPKPMIPILDIPLLAGNIEKLKKYGIDEFILSTFYLPEKIKEYFGNGKRQGVKISYLNEKTPLGTAGAIKAAERFFSETFFVFNADIVSDIDFSAMLRLHQMKKASVTIAVTAVENPASYGVIEYDTDGYITAFKEKPKAGETLSHLINAGIYIFEPEVLREIEKDCCVSIEKQTYPLLLQKHYKMALYNKCSYWRDLGTPKDYLVFHEDILSGKIQMPIHDFLKDSYFVGAGAHIDETVKIIRPVYIGHGVTIEANSIIGPYAVIGQGTFIGKAAVLNHCVVWADTVIGENAKITDAIILSDCVMAVKRKHSPDIVAGPSPERVAG